MIRQMLGTGPVRLRLQLLLVAGVLMAPLIAERGAGGGEPTPSDAAG